MVDEWLGVERGGEGRGGGWGQHQVAVRRGRGMTTCSSESITSDAGSTTRPPMSLNRCFHAGSICSGHAANA